MACAPSPRTLLIEPTTQRPDSSSRCKTFGIPRRIQERFGAVMIDGFLALASAADVKEAERSSPAPTEPPPSSTGGGYEVE